MNLFGPKHTLKDALVTLEAGLNSGEIVITKTQELVDRVDKLLKAWGLDKKLVESNPGHDKEFPPLITVCDFMMNWGVVGVHCDIVMPCREGEPKAVKHPTDGRWIQNQTANFVVTKREAAFSTDPGLLKIIQRRFEAALKRMAPIGIAEQQALVYYED